MVYNKKELIEALECSILNEENDFDSSNNEDFMDSMGKDFCDCFYHEYGASKLALIPIDDNEDYVIKIPYTGSRDRESGYYDSENYYHHGYNFYYEYTCAECEDRVWDYCGGEAQRYLIAEEEGLGMCFAKTEFLGFANGYPIYIQERCKTFSQNNSKKHSKEEKITTSKLCGNYYNINSDWLTDFRLYYGNDILIHFVHFIKTMGWDDDLRNDNIGYIGNRPVLIDYSGFLEN